MDFWNILDLTRIILIYRLVLSEALGWDWFDSFLPVMFLVVWLRIFNQLQVFDPVRYLIKMIMEIIIDIQSFMLILILAMVAYAHISYLTKEAGNVNEEIKESYVLAFGELGNYPDFDFLRFFIFILFTLFVPLLLMNMLIAIMSDAYERVQANAMSADYRSMAQMLQEMEEVMNYILHVFRPEAVKTKYQYLFFTTAGNVSDGIDNQMWSGMVGELKNTIKQAEERITEEQRN